MQTLIFDRRNAEQTSNTTPSFEQTLSPVRDYLAAFAVMPSFHLTAPSALLAATQHYGADARLPGGVALSLLDTTPVTEANVHLLVNDRLGMGVSAYTVRDAVDESTLLERFAQARRAGTLPRLSPYASLHGVALVKYRQPGDDALRFAIAVRANDAPAAIKLLELATTASVAGDAPTLGQIESAPEYRALLESSEAYRRQLALATAEALGVTLEPVPFVSAASHTIVRSTDAPQCTVYHDVYNTTASPQGALVRVGAHNGYLHVQSAAGAGGAWHTPALSALDASTGAPPAAGAETGEPPAAAERLHYAAPLPGVEHPLAAERAASRSDPAVRASIAESGGAPTADLQFVAGIAPDLPSVQYGTLGELAALAVKTATQAVPVPIDHPVLTQIAAHWTDLKPHLPAEYSLSQAFASEYPAAPDPLLELHSAHAETHAAAESQPTTIAADRHFGASFDARRRPRPFWDRWAWRGGRGYGRHYGIGAGAAIALDIVLLSALAALLARK